MNKKENINKKKETKMKKSSDRWDSFLVSSLLFKHIPFYQNESKTHPAMPVKYWVGKTSLILLVLFTLSHCAYSPVVDSRGNNGKNVAHRLTDDIQTCKAIAEQNTSNFVEAYKACLLYTSPSPRDLSTSRMPSSA